MSAKCTPETPEPQEGRARLSITIRPHVLDAVRAAAARADRSLSYVIDQALHAALVGDVLVESEETP
jgi:hypothetical protein